MLHKLMREIRMAKALRLGRPHSGQAKSAKNAAADTNESVEPMVIALAEQLGTLLGRVRAKADGWLENDALRQQVTQIRDGATQLLDRVNRASVAARQSVAKPKKSNSKSRTAASKARSGGAVDAQGKRYRKPPPQELFDPRLGEPMGKQMGQKNLRRRGRG
jgi:hypothetical protein